jgi:hypothetical protein
VGSWVRRSRSARSTASAASARSWRARASVRRSALIQRADRPLPKMQALGACMNKLLLYAFAVMSRREAFQLDHGWQRTMARVA